MMCYNTGYRRVAALSISLSQRMDHVMNTPNDKEIITRKQAKLLGLKYYYTGKPCIHGHYDKRKVKTKICVECVRSWFRAYRKLPRVKEKVQVIKAKYTSTKKYKMAHREWKKQYRKTDKGKLSVKVNHIKRRGFNNRIPLWANKNEIKSIYKKATETGLVVDHIIPLCGKNVSGLHVENNLQLLTALENMRKGNKYELE